MIQAIAAPVIDDADDADIEDDEDEESSEAVAETRGGDEAPAAGDDARASDHGGAGAAGIGIAAAKAATERRSATTPTTPTCAMPRADDGDAEADGETVQSEAAVAGSDEATAEETRRRRRRGRRGGRRRRRGGEGTSESGTRRRDAETTASSGDAASDAMGTRARRTPTRSSPDEMESGENAPDIDAESAEDPAKGSRRPRRRRPSAVKEPAAEAPADTAARAVECGAHGRGDAERDTPFDRASDERGQPPSRPWLSTPIRCRLPGRHQSAG